MSDSDIDAIKSRLDIVEVVGHYVPGLKRAGRSYKACCPFHQEKTPSFVVTPEIQRFKCFGCGEGGDVISFIQKMERVDFPKALEIAAEQAGYELKHNYSAESEAVKLAKQRLIEANKLAMKYWNYTLQTHPAGKIGRDYLTTRQIRNEEVQKFQLGYAPKGNNLKQFLIARGYEVKDLVSWGLLAQWDTEIVDKFRDRLILPVLDMNGNPIGFSGRIITPNERAPKYLNSPETIIYHKGEILMGLYQAKEAARKSNFLILEEGNIDLLSSHKVGIENIAATGGTALTEQQCKLIKRFADTVYFCFDTDAAGIKALLRGLELAERVGLKHKALNIGSYQDPDELIRNEPQKWAEVVAAPTNTIAHLLQTYALDLDLGTADGKSTLVERMLPVLRVVRDPVQVQHFAEQVALQVGITTQQILDGVDRDGQERGGKAVAAAAPTSQSAPLPSREARPPHHLDATETYLLALLMQIGQVTELEISAEIFTDVNYREIYLKLLQHKDAPLDLNLLTTELSDGANEVLQEQVLPTDLSGVTDFHQELITVYKRAYKSYLKVQLGSLKHQLQARPDDTTLLTKLQYFSNELNSLGKETH